MDVASNYVDLSTKDNTGRKIYIEVEERDGMEVIWCDWTARETDGFKTIGEVLHTLAAAMSSVQKSMQETELQQRPFVGKPPWVKRGK